MTFYTNIRSYGNDLLYIGYDKQGNRVQKRVPFKPKFYVRDNNIGAQSKFSTIEGSPIKEMSFDSIRESKDFLDTYSDVTDFNIYGHNKFPVQFIAKYFPGDISYTPEHIRIFFFDIEVMADDGFPEPDVARKPITCMSLYDTKTQKTYCWGIKPYKSKSENVVWFQFSEETEKEMLQHFVSWWQMNYPDIISGWHSRGFDLPYIINRIKNLLGDQTASRLSPWGRIQKKQVKTQKFSTEVEETNYDIYGIADLDYKDLYIKYSQSASETYKLDFIAEKELGEKKLEFEGTLHQLYMTDFERYVDYNIQDVNLVKRLEEVKKFLSLIIEVSYVGHVPTYTDSLGTVSYWEYLIYNYLYTKNIIPEVKKRKSGAGRDYQYEGAYVKDPQVGLHEWVVAFDLTSLYPSVIRQLLIGPETLISKANIPGDLLLLTNNVTLEKLIDKEIDTSILKKYNYSMGANGALYSREKTSFISDLVGNIFNLRKLYKKQMIEAKREYENTHNPAAKKRAEILDIKQHAMKILINSCYGALGNQWFQYYSIENAEAVTITGQMVIRWTEKRINAWINKLLKTDNFDYIIASDTDSLYINFAPLVKAMFKEENPDKQKVTDFLDKFCQEKVTKFLEEIYVELCDYINGYENHMEMKREIIADRAIWTAKKRYAANTLDSEGVRFETPELKVKGLEIVKSSTPSICRDKLEESVKILLTGNENQLIDFVDTFKKDFKKLSPKDIAFPRGVKGLDTYANATKSVPIHVRGSLNYNRLIQKHGLSKTVEMIKNGTKIKYLYLRTPNHIHDKVISFLDKLPTEFNLERHIDYDTQFEKSFLEPLKKISDLVGWKLEKPEIYDDLFS